MIGKILKVIEVAKELLVGNCICANVDHPSLGKVLITFGIRDNNKATFRIYEQ